MNQQIQVTDGITGTTGSGNIEIIIMESWNEPYTPLETLLISPFNDTMKFSVKGHGFETLNRTRTYIPHNMEVRISRDPVAILEIMTEMEISDMLGLGQTKAQVEQRIRQSQQNGLLLENLTTVILQDMLKVKIVLKEQENIEDLVDSGARDTTDLSRKPTEF